MRSAKSKNTAAMVLNMNPRQVNSSLKKKDLDNLENFNHGKTLLNNKNLGDQSQKGRDEGRSIKSEIDYAQKKNFVEYLPEKKPMGLNNLKIDKDGIANPSQRTGKTGKLSVVTSKKQHSNAPSRTVESLADDEEVVLIDKEGVRIELTPEQIEFLKKIGNKESGELPAEVNIEALRLFAPDKYQELMASQGQQFDEDDAEGAGKFSKHYSQTNKKYFDKNMHSNSDDFKNLGNIHSERRKEEYPRSNGKDHFSPKPLNLSKYDYEKGGLSYQQRIPENYVGEDMKHVRNETDSVNNNLMQMQVEQMLLNQKFPLTTNQDFHNEDVFERAKRINNDRKNYKTKNLYGAYVNATFNQGVFTNPIAD